MYEKLLRNQVENLSRRLPQPQLPLSFLQDAAQLLIASAALQQSAREELSQITTHESRHGLSRSTVLAAASNAGSLALKAADVQSSLTAINRISSNAKQPSTDKQFGQLQQTKRQSAEDSERSQTPLLPYIDVAQLYAHVLQKVPHISAFNPPERASNEASDSFDENSLYSSQGWSPPEANGDRVNRKQSNGSDIMDISDEGEIYEPSQNLPANTNDASNSDQASYGNEAAMHAEEEYEPYVPARPPRTYERDVLQYADDEGDDYSPPPPDTYADSAQQDARYENQFRGPEPPPMARTYYSRRGKAHHYRQRNDQFNARPAANSKNRRSDGDRAQGWQKRQGQDDSRQNIHVSKKRRFVAEPEAPQAAAGKRRAVTPANGSPEPYIKPEPVSPVPFSFEETAPSKNSRRVTRANADDVELISPRVVRRPSDHQSGYESAYDDYASSSNGHEASNLHSPIALRRAQRDDQDLRRVASLQNARRPRSPVVDSAGYTDGRVLAHQSSRSFSALPAGRKVYPTSVSFSEDLDLQGFEARPESNYGALGHAIVDGKVVPVIQVQNRPPSPRKVVFVDQLGNRYYDKPPHKQPEPAVLVRQPRKIAYIDDDGYQYFEDSSERVIRQPTAPVLRRLDSDSYHTRAATQQPVVMQQYRPVPAQEEIDDYQRMPPPRFRRTATYADEEPRVEPRQRAYSMHPLQPVSSRDAEMVDASSQQYDPARPATSVRNIPYTQQRTTSEYLPRAYSLHPEPAVRQDTMTYQPTIPTSSQQRVAASLPQPDYVPRAYSVRPEPPSSRSGVDYQRQPSGYVQNTTSDAAASASYPARAYSVGQPSVSRNQALHELMTRYDPPASSSQPMYPPAQMAQQGRTFSGANVSGSNVYGGSGGGGYSYR